MSFNFKGGPKVGGAMSFAGGPSINLRDPLDGVPVTGDMQVDSAAELTAMEQAYRDRAKAEAKRFTDATDSEYWFAVCFTSREEKDQFLAEFGLAKVGDKYLDGHQVAAQLRNLNPGEE